MSLAQILANVEQLQKEQADIYDSGQRYSDRLAPGAYGRLGDQMFIDQTDGGTFKDPYFQSLMYGNPNLIEDYFSTGRFENFNPRVGMGSAPSNDINQIILNNIAQLSDANEGNIGTDDVLQEPGLFQRGYDYLSGDRGGIARGILGLLTGGPIGALIGYNSPSIMSGVSDGISGLFKNFNDRRRGRLDVTADAGIMPTGREIGALTTADDYGSGSDGGRSAAEQSFSDSQSYGGGGSMDDMGADSFY